MSDIYEVIYDTISENMIGAGSQYPYNKETFLNDIGTGTQEVDVSRFLDLPNDKFYQANPIENEGLAVEKETRILLLEKYTNKVISE